MNNCLFKACLREENVIVDVYAVDVLHDRFLYNDHGYFRWGRMNEFKPIHNDIDNIIRCENCRYYDADIRYCMGSPGYKRDAKDPDDSCGGWRMKEDES